MHHFWRWSYLRIDFEPSEKTFDTLEDVDKSFLASANIFNCLKEKDVTTGNPKESRNLSTKSRTPTPAKITFAGEKTYQYI
jgi:hypothetical protein